MFILVESLKLVIFPKIHKFSYNHSEQEGSFEIWCKKSLENGHFVGQSEVAL